MTDTPGTRSGAAPPPAGGGFAVVELFTSQGCNSCPPAEELLSEIESDARERGQPVYALGFHVDYWDHLGWADPYGDAAHTRRQEAYARAFRARGLYTPQMIVNGTVEFVGSDRRQASSAIASALTEEAAVPLGLSVEDLAEGTGGGCRVVVNYQAERPPERAVLNVAAVERGLENDVPRGENAGRRLRQDNVVRAFTSAQLAQDPGRGRLELELSSELDPRHASVVGYVQNEDDKSIVGVAAVDLSARLTR
ncbi:DUF1223 domain-containing protein [Micromonospora soli]|uniref:DUF1223 domain-containing protein n=1 Tax=Micromonospora sp. NBRC 110009 TaxID=3061627 RepID=UPI0026731A79|nr:DUF1223 domain-containing protein [Micromonospora sp. NBRC 110009]WKT97466.1 DUF1223 domain-containing protein [Micromonospora sp. NBRC 110009]